MENLDLISKDLFHGIYHGRRVFVTGDTGFKGSWLVQVLKMLGAEVHGYALEPRKNIDNFARCDLAKEIQHTTGNILDAQKIEEEISKCNPDFIFHLAAQSLVLDSFTDPVGTFQTNIIGSILVFEAARKTGFKGVIINVTSDKCYANREWVWGYRENDPMGGKDPYSASKGALEIVADAYRQSFLKKEGIKLASVRAGNVIGGGDWADNRIVPDALRALQNEQPLLVRNPLSTRPWQFVLEPLFGYLTVAASLWEGHEAEGGWNFGPLEQNQYSVGALVDELYRFLGKGVWKDGSSNNAPPEANYLRLDISKAITLLGWHPVLTFKDTLAFVGTGYLDEMNASTSDELRTKRKCQIFDYVNRFMEVNRHLCG